MIRALVLTLVGTCAFAEEAVLKTSDGWDLPATYWAPDAKAPSGRGILLLHMLNGRRSDWNVFAKKLSKAGHAVLAVELRGHGGAKKDGKPVAVKTFADADYAAMVEDVRVAVEWLLARKDAKIESLFFVGAGFTASLVVEYLAAGTEAPVGGMVLLSPRLQDHGLTLEETITKVETRAILAACREDHPCFEETGKLFELKHGKREFLRYAKGLSGTEILGKFPELTDDILRFIAE